MEYSFFAASGARLFGRVNVNTRSRCASASGRPPPRRKPSPRLSRATPRRGAPTNPPPPRARCPRAARTRTRTPPIRPRPRRSLRPRSPPSPSPPTRRRRRRLRRLRARPRPPIDLLRLRAWRRRSRARASARRPPATPRRGRAAAGLRGGSHCRRRATTPPKSHPSRRFTCAKKSFISPSSATAARLSWLNATVTPRCISAHRVHAVAHGLRLDQRGAEPGGFLALQPEELRGRAEVRLQLGAPRAERVRDAAEAVLLPALEREVVPELRELALLLRAELGELRAERVHDHDVRHASPRAAGIGAIAGSEPRDRLGRKVVEGTQFAGKLSERSTNARTSPSPFAPLRWRASTAPVATPPRACSRRRPRSRAPPRASPRPRRRVHSRRRTRAASSRSAIAGDGAPRRTRPGTRGPVLPLRGPVAADARDARREPGQARATYGDAGRGPADGIWPPPADDDVLAREDVSGADARGGRG